MSELKPVQSKQAVSESKPASQAAPSSSSDSQESNTNAYKTNNMTSNNVENNQLIGHAETENDYQNAQQYSEQKPSADSTQTEIFEESQDDNQLENEQVDQSTSSSVSEVSDITEESEETTHPNNTSGQQDNDDQQKIYSLHFQIKMKIQLMKIDLGRTNKMLQQIKLYKHLSR